MRLFSTGGPCFVLRDRSLSSYCVPDAVAAVSLSPPVRLCPRADGTPQGVLLVSSLFVFLHDSPFSWSFSLSCAAGAPPFQRSTLTGAWWFRSRPCNAAPYPLHSLRLPPATAVSGAYSCLGGRFSPAQAPCFPVLLMHRYFHCCSCCSGLPAGLLHSCSYWLLPR